MSSPSQYTATEAPTQPEEPSEGAEEPNASGTSSRGKRTGRKKLARQRLAGSPLLYVADSLRPSVQALRLAYSRGGSSKRGRRSAKRGARGERNENEGEDDDEEGCWLSKSGKVKAGVVALLALLGLLMQWEGIAGAVSTPTDNKMPGMATAPSTMNVPVERLADSAGYTLGQQQQHQQLLLQQQQQLQLLEAQAAQAAQAAAQLPQAAQTAYQAAPIVGQPFSAAKRVEPIKLELMHQLATPPLPPPTLAPREPPTPMRPMADEETAMTTAMATAGAPSELNNGGSPPSKIESTNPDARENRLAARIREMSRKQEGDVTKAQADAPTLATAAAAPAAPAAPGAPDPVGGPAAKPGVRFRLRQNARPRPATNRPVGSRPQQTRGNRAKPMIWVHIHKAAGSFMCGMAQRAERLVSPNDNCNWRKHDGFPDLMKRGSSVDCKRRLETWRAARWSWGALEREIRPEDKCWDQFDYGVSLREPVEIMHSFLNYDYANWHGQPKDSLLAQVKQKLAAHAADHPGLPQWKFFDNIQTRLLTDSLDVPAGEITKAHVDKALELLSHFSVVTRVEDLQREATRKAVFKKLGWNHDVVYKQASVERVSNHIKKDFFVFTEAEKEWLREINKWDMLLYRSISPIQAEAE